MKQRLIKLAHVAAAQVPDLLMAGGAMAIATGAAQVYGPAGWIAGGVLAITGGIVMARGRA